MRVTALVAGLALLVLAATPVAASPNDDHGGSPPWARNDGQRPDWDRDGRNQDGNHDNDNRSPWWDNDNRDDGAKKDKDGPDWQQGGWGPWGRDRREHMAALGLTPTE